MINAFLVFAGMVLATIVAIPMIVTRVHPLIKAAGILLGLIGLRLVTMGMGIV